MWKVCGCSTIKEIAREIAIVPLKIANAYLVGTGTLWFLVDSGLPGDAPAIRKAVAARFGANARPAAIVLTHGHADHAGSARELADEWDVKVHVSRLEMPYLSGLSQYPPLDPTAPGIMSLLSRFVSVPSINLGNRLAVVDKADPFPGLHDWWAIDTPGHSPGQLSYFRKGDGILLAGDAVTTMNTESLLGFFSKGRKLCGPPLSSTLNWPQAWDSVAKLVLLEPRLLAAGHGKPMRKPASKLRKLSRKSSVPSRGRFAHAPAQVGEGGIISLPPAPPDPLPSIARSILVLSVAAGVGAVYPKIRLFLKKTGCF